MDDSNKRARGLIGRIYGGLNMSWTTVVLLAVGSAALTTVFLILPAFKDTSFERMGVHFEAWFFFAILIMANCEKPLESATKTFAFFLISQPLIYLFQVPFSALGWGIFRYYRYWAIWTLLTFPMAYLGWYIRKKNGLSLLLLAPVFACLGVTAWQCGAACAGHFPRLLLAALFCVFQIALYGFAFCPGGWWRAAGAVVSVAAVLVLTLSGSGVEIDGTAFLPDDAFLSDSAVVVMEADSGWSVTIESTGEDSMIRVRSSEMGECDFAIQDGDSTLAYTVRVYEDASGHTQIHLEAR